MRTKPINTPSPTHTLSTPPRLRLIYWQAVMNDPPTSTYIHMFLLFLQFYYRSRLMPLDFILILSWLRRHLVYMFDFLTDKQYTYT